MIEFLIVLFAIAFNPLRGGDYDKLFFNWYTQVFFYGVIAYLVSDAWQIALITMAQWIFLWVTGTGGLMQAYTSINNTREFKPFDWIAHRVAGITWTGKGIRYNNLWGIWYGTLVGIVMAIPLLGLLCRATKYWDSDGMGWRRTETAIAAYYWISFTLLVALLK